jgi:hypothetical protein
MCTGAPGLDLLQRRHILDRLLHVPHLIRVDHQHGPGRPCILPGKRRTARVARHVAVREVLWVVDDRADQLAAAQVIRAVRADFHLEVVEAGLHGLSRQTRDLLV